MVATNQIKNLEHHIFFLGDQLSSLPFEPFKIMEKTSKSSAPVLSAVKPLFPKVFRISGQLLWLSVAPMRARCMAPTALFFASRTEIRVVFRVARVVKSLGF